MSLAASLVHLASTTMKKCSFLWCANAMLWPSCGASNWPQLREPGASAVANDGEPVVHFAN